MHLLVKSSELIVVLAYGVSATFQDKLIYTLEILVRDMANRNVKALIDSSKNDKERRG